jgi:cytochrome P450 monooxygenase
MTCREEALSASEELVALTVRDDPPMQGANSFLRELQAKGPVIRVQTPAGDEAWLVTRHAETRELLADPRLGRSHRDPGNAPKYLDNPMMDLIRLEFDFATELEAHAERRALLTPYFSGRNIRALQPRVTQMVDEAVGRLVAQGPPVDVHSQFSKPLTAHVLGELLGVPSEDRAAFPAFMHQLSALGDMQHHAESGRDTLLGYFRGLAARKRAEPGEDVLSDMALRGYNDERCAWTGVGLLFAGFGSTSTETTMGIARIATDPVLHDRLVADPGLIKSAVAEFLRTAGSAEFIFPHYAREDIEIADVTIRAGDLVLMNYGLANFDERAFRAPDELDITRSPNPHLAFAYGGWHCSGAPLAKMQLTTTFTALLAALPTLRLAKPLEDMDRTPGYMSSLAELLVTW